MPAPHRPDDSAPSPWVARFAGLAAAGGRALDVAAGGGRHARHLRQRGFQVTALDIDTSGLAAEAGLKVVTADLEGGRPWPLAGRRFDLVVVVNYLHRPLFAALRASLAPAGVLIYDSFAVGNERFGRPRNPDFLLRPGELLQAFAGLQTIAYEHGEEAQPKPAVRQRLAAVDGGEPRPIPPPR